MDKYEYRIRTEEIKTLIAKGEYAEAAEIADGIDWRRVKSVMMLCTISDLYKVNRRFDDSKEMLLLAYDRHPGGRSIVYSLCELSIKMGEFVEAVEYYKEFIQVAPRDNGRYILQYKLYEAQDVSLEERIAVLEELKSRDYVEKWAYELAYLYHRVGLATRCVEECDDLILWFGEGKYVMKAMELKMLHEPLTPVQQEKYDLAKGLRREAMDREDKQFDIETPGGVMDARTLEMPTKELDIQVKVMGVGQYDTINMQKELAEHMKELWEGTEADGEGTVSQETKVVSVVKHEADEMSEVIMADETADEKEETEISEEDVVEQEEYAEEAEKYLEEPEDTNGEEPVSEVFFGETGDLDTTANQVMEAMRNEASGIITEEDEEDELPGQLSFGAEMGAGDMKEITVGAVIDVTERMQEETPASYKVYDKMIGMEYDGQLSMLLPESEQIEKQITGQICLEDVLIEWERMKQESEQKRREAVEQRVLEQTGAMFTQFDESSKDGLLEQLERGIDIKSVTVEDFVSEDEEEPEETEEFEEVEELEEVEEPEGFEGSDEPEEVNELEEAEEFEEVEEPGVVEEPEEPEETEEAEDPEEATEVEETEEFETVEATEEVVETEETVKTVETESEMSRALSPEEEELFGAYMHSQKSKEQILAAIDKMTLASFTGNVVITGDENMDTLTLAKNLIKEVQNTDSNFSGRIAKISGASLNKKDVEETLDKMENGALIVQSAAGMTKETATKLYRTLEQEERGVIVILIDTKKAMCAFLKENEILNECFTLRVDVEAPGNDILVEYGKKYAREKEYSIDDLGVLALHTVISERQTIDHVVTVNEVCEIIDEAISNANRKTIGHFFDILIAKRYDDEDMIILREKDFI